MIFSILKILLAVSGTFYLMLIFVFWLLQRGAKRAALAHRDASGTGVSVVITARNEMERIGPCLTALERLTYPQLDHEIILVDDCSSDGTADLIAAAVKRNPNWRLIRFAKPAGASGAMYALSAGIAEAKHEIILRTDSDCQVGVNWIQSMTCRFDGDTAMVIGFCNLKVGRGPIQAFLSFENLVAGLLNSSFAKLGFPIGCSGGNMAFRKSAFDAVGGFGALLHYVTGEDTHLAQRFLRHGVGKIKFCLCGNSIVQTRPPARKLDVFRRMLRVNGETLRMDIGQIFLRVFFAVGYFSPFYLLSQGAVTAFAALVAARYVLEFQFLHNGASTFNRDFNLLPNVICQFIYPFYLILFTFLGSVLRVRWR